MSSNPCDICHHPSGHHDWCIRSGVAVLACTHKLIGLEKQVELSIGNWGGCWQTFWERLDKLGYKLMESK